MDTVPDEEILYRRVPALPGYCEMQTDGTILITSMAFSERNQQPSVFRAALCQNNPTFIQEQETDGVISLLTKEVCAKDFVRNDSKGRPIQNEIYTVRVIPDPLNPAEARPEIAEAHAVIILDPKAPKGIFDRFRTYLARLANQRAWEIVPQIQTTKGNGQQHNQG